MTPPTAKAQLLADLENVFSGQPWFGDSVLTVLESITPQQAMTPVSGRRIYSLIRHVLAWRGYLLRQLLGETDFDIEVNSVADWPPYQGESLEAWPRVLASLKESQRLLLATLRGFPDERWYDTVPHRRFSFAFLVNGLIQHDVYHLGQAALLA